MPPSDTLSDSIRIQAGALFVRVWRAGMEDRFESGEKRSEGNFVQATTRVPDGVDGERLEPYCATAANLVQGEKA